MKLVLHDLTDKQTLDREARQQVRGGGEPSHTAWLPGFAPVGSVQPEYTVTTDGEPQHTVQLGW